MPETYPTEAVNLMKNGLTLKRSARPWRNWLLGSSSLKAPPEELLERALQELVRYYRYSAAGRRCHGIIHNLNGPLQVLSFQLELLEQKALEEQENLSALSPPATAKLAALIAQRRRRFKQMAQEIDNLQTMTNRLLYQGTHEDREDPVYVDLNRLYRDELSLYQDNLFFKHHVQTHFTFEDNLPPIYGHYLDFSQSFRNLVDNALEAMEKAEIRRLTVATSLKGNKRLLRVGDTGCGIPAGLADRIFEPFFTTKGTPEHPHSGLGLYMAQRLLAPYGGYIQVKSRPGETWVTMVLPVLQG